MEDRKKTLKDLENSRAETLKLLDIILEKLGEFLISGAEEPADFPPFEPQEDNPSLLTEEKNKLLKEISDSEDEISAIETSLRNLGKLNSNINVKEQEKNSKNGEVYSFYSELGHAIMGTPGFGHFTGPFEPKLNDITLKINIQKKKLEEYDNAGNLLARIGGNVKGMMARTILSRCEAALERLFISAGEEYLVSLENPSSGRISAEEINLANEGELGVLTQKGKELRGQLASIKDEIEILKRERRGIIQSLDKVINPARRISELEIYITRTREEIRKVHHRFGSLVLAGKWQKFFASRLKKEKDLYEKMTSLDYSVKLTEKEIDSVKTAMAVDNENAEIEKIYGLINGKRQLIADAEASIADMENSILEAQKRIDGLTKKDGQNQ